MPYICIHPDPSGEQQVIIAGWYSRQTQTTTCVLAFLCTHCKQPMNTFSTMQKLHPLRYEMLIYFLVEGSQGNHRFTSGKSVPCSPPVQRDGDNNSWDSNLSAKWDQFPSFSEGRRPRPFTATPAFLFFGVWYPPRLAGAPHVRQWSHRWWPRETAGRCLTRARKMRWCGGEKQQKTSKSPPNAR